MLIGVWFLMLLPRSLLPTLVVGWHRAGLEFSTPLLTHHKFDPAPEAFMSIQKSPSLTHHKFHPTPEAFVSIQKPSLLTHHKFYPAPEAFMSIQTSVILLVVHGNQVFAYIYVYQIDLDVVLLLPCTLSLCKSSLSSIQFSVSVGTKLNLTTILQLLFFCRS